MKYSINDLNVATVINLIASGEIKVKDLSSFYEKSDRTIQKVIKGLGYVWDSKGRKYTPDGEGYEKSNDDKLFSDFVNPSTFKALTENKGRKNSTKKVVKDNNNVNSIDNSIDNILFGKGTNNGRVQRAYYLDTDIAGIIDNIDGKQKSNLVNDCLRKVFKEKGLL